MTVTRHTEHDVLELTSQIEILRMQNERLRAENEDLRSRVKPKKEKPVRKRCPHTTAKGSQCLKFCCEGFETCKVHSKPLKPAKPARPPRVKRQQCIGTNIRGNPCRGKCIEGKTYCERHDPDIPVVSKKPKRQAKKVVPMHTHGPGEKPVIPCKLCQTHGNMFNPGTVNICFTETPGIDGYTLRNRIIKKICV